MSLDEIQRTLGYIRGHQVRTHGDRMYLDHVPVLISENERLRSEYLAAQSVVEAYKSAQEWRDSAHTVFCQLQGLVNNGDLPIPGKCARVFDSVRDLLMSYPSAPPAEVKTDE